MLFDSLLGLAERRYLPEHVARLVTNSRLFVFPGRAHEVLAGESSPASDEEVADLNAHFRLPFDTVAVEDSASLVIIGDVDEDQEGLGCSRVFVEFLQMVGPKDSEFSNPVEVSPELQRLFAGTFSVCWGAVDQLAYDPKRYGGNHFHANFRYGGHGLYEKKEGLRRDLMHYLPQQFVLRNAGNNVLTAIAEINAFNQPNRWILEESPATPPREGKKQKREPRSHERPRYTLLKPEQIREKLGMPPLGSPDATSPRPHERRGHWRTYRDARFTKLMSQRRWVKAAWIGPSEVVVGKRRYKVMLDL